MGRLPGLLAAGLLMARPGPAGSPAVIVERGVEYGRAGTRPLLMDLSHPREAAKSGRPAIVLVHGGGWVGGDRGDMMKSMVGYAEAGYFSASVGYRLSPEAAFPAQIHDCKCAIRFLRGHAKRFALDPGRIGVVGWSAGGHLAALLGTSGGVRELEGDGGWPGVSSRVQAVCDYFGPADFTDWMTGHEWGAWNEDAKRAVLGLFGDARRNRPAAARMASPVTYASKDDPPFLIIHGTADPIVPFRQSELLREALRKAGVEAGLVTVEGAGHGDASFWAAKPWEPEAAFFARVLKAVRGI